MYAILCDHLYTYPVGFLAKIIKVDRPELIFIEISTLNNINSNFLKQYWFV